MGQPMSEAVQRCSLSSLLLVLWSLSIRWVCSAHVIKDNIASSLTPSSYDMEDTCTLPEPHS